MAATRAYGQACRALLEAAYADLAPAEREVRAGGGAHLLDELHHRHRAAPAAREVDPVSPDTTHVRLAGHPLPDLVNIIIRNLPHISPGR